MTDQPQGASPQENAGAQPKIHVASPPDLQTIQEQLRNNVGKDAFSLLSEEYSTNSGPNAKLLHARDFHKDLKPSTSIDRRERGLDAVKTLEKERRHTLTNEQITNLDTACGDMRAQIIEFGRKHYTEDPNLRSKFLDIERRLNELVLTLFPDLQVSFSDLCDEGRKSHASVPEQTLILEKVADVHLWWSETIEKDPYLKCFVVAAFVLYGSPVHKIARARDELYQMHLDGLDKKAKKDAQQNVNLNFENVLQDSYTLVLRFQSADRLYWAKDSYIPLLQEFIARQATIAGIRFGESNLLDILETWAARDDNDVAWRAVRALAVIWWRQSRDQIWELVKDWTHVDPHHSLQNAVDLLLATFEEERNTALSEQQPQDMITIKHITRLSRGEPSENLTLVLAAVYGAIGRNFPDLALDELDTLFHLTPKQLQKQEIEESSLVIFILVGAVSYLAIAQAGHIRKVLGHIASNAAFLANNTLRDSKDDVRIHHAFVFLFLFYFLFGHIAHFSYTSAREDHSPYERRLRIPSMPDFPSDDGRDLILAGLLSVYEHDWRINIRVTLAAAIALGHEDAVFPFLKDWAEIVCAENTKVGSHDIAAKGIYESYGAFLVEIVNWVDNWCQQQGLKGLEVPNRILRQKLKAWAKDSAFAQEVIDSL